MKKLSWIVPVMAAVAFLSYIWWACWFLRAGPTGPLAWAFYPVIMTGVGLGLSVAILTGWASDKDKR